MKKKFLAFIIKWLQKKYAQTFKKELKELPYNSLSPIGNANIDSDYRKALDWALKNRSKEDIKNIALTGPYGSGKSSILKTYVETSPGNEFNFLNISLATFKEEEESQNPH